MTDTEHDFPHYRAGYIGTLKHEDDLERAAEVKEAQLDVLAAELFQQYIADEEMIVDVLLEDTEVLHEIAEAFLNPTITDGNVYKVIRKYVAERAEDDAREELGDR